MIGLSTSGSISFGCALVAGRNRVPRPAAGNTALRTTVTKGILTEVSDDPGATDFWFLPGIYNGARGSMIDPTYVREHLEEVRQGLANRGLDPDQALSRLTELDTLRRRIIPQIEELKREQNKSSEEIARAKKQGLDTADIQVRNGERAQTTKTLETGLDARETERTAA